MSNSDQINYKKPITSDFSDGFYDWSIFLVNLYLRVQQILKIDFESFMILQIVVGYHVNDLNKSGSTSINQLAFRFEEIVNKKAIQIPKLTVTSISSALNIPRETVKRKADHLIKEKYLSSWFKITNFKLFDEFKISDLANAISRIDLKLPPCTYAIFKIHEISG